MCHFTFVAGEDHRAIPIPSLAAVLPIHSNLCTPLFFVHCRRVPAIAVRDWNLLHPRLVHFRGSMRVTAQALERVLAGDAVESCLDMAEAPAKG